MRYDKAFKLNLKYASHASVLVFACGLTMKEVVHTVSASTNVVQVDFISCAGLI